MSELFSGTESIALLSMQLSFPPLVLGPDGVEKCIRLKSYTKPISRFKEEAPLRILCDDN